LSGIEFTKMQGLGNDFIVIEGPVRLTVDQVTALCDRRRGVGADGILVISLGTPIVMDYWNADGSPAEMCGNGLRCVARYARDRGWVAGDEFGVDTPVGLRRVRIRGDLLEAEMGSPLLEGVETIEGHTYHLVDIGNPHAVRLVDDPADVDVRAIGPVVAQQAGFDAGCNVEFISVEGDVLTMRVWERGVGETLACGTGMAAAAAVALNGADGTMTVEVPGGAGSVEIRDGVAWLTGPAEYSFRGTWDQG
jgi:diaminopimelate epimerase